MAMTQRQKFICTGGISKAIPRATTKLPAQRITAVRAMT